MTFQSPSERLKDRLGRFVFLRDIDGVFLSHAIWIVSVVIFVMNTTLELTFGFQFVSNIYNQATTGAGIPIMTLIHYLFTYAANLLTDIVYLMLVRLAVEVSSKILAGPSKTVVAPPVSG